jgi:bacillithiol system protein YtxJ
MKQITTRSDLDAVTALPMALLLKHGATCPISAHAREEVSAFAADRPELPIYMLEVTEHRSLSEAAAKELGVAHESPQAVLLHDGEPVWHAEHFDISRRALTAAISEAGTRA